MLATPDGPERPRRPDFGAQHTPDRDFPIYDCRVLRLAPEVPDYSALTPRDLAALAAAYLVEAIACEIMLGRPELARREGLRAEVWRDRWECAALTARIAAQCCNSRLKGRRRRE
ncbi:hypothetical protein [Amaricoccus sp.]|uniref:hypothetical protein n=1 Tax=Amaricoccus sp. TaxID=1872485 RepID=UPI001B76795A|nr:hypothetical protein [Amaricoccus sp.]MBP7001695.1 hypothetical protein [Amaricoccus sp.]